MQRTMDGVIASWQLGDTWGWDYPILAIATAIKAIHNGSDALFTTAAALIIDLVAAACQGQLIEATNAYRDPDVLIIDEVGYLSYVDDAANVLYGVVDAPYLDRPR